MFENIRKCLDEYENAINASKDGNVTTGQERTIFRFEMHLAEELIEEDYIDSKLLANIILAAQF